MSEVDQYAYDLPENLIAQEPLARRADARLLLVERSSQQISHWHVRDLPQILRTGDCLVLNDTQVVPARLVGFRQKTRGRWHGLFLSADEHGFWRLLCKARGRLEPGESITLLNRQLQEQTALQLISKHPDGVWVAKPGSNEPYLELLARCGRVPLPHYIRHGEMVDADLERYQTVFAARPGAIAAPTAGLHFTPELLAKLQGGGVVIARVTLHAGAGTFRPISSANLAEHEMHSEWGQIEQPTIDSIQEARRRGGRIVAVGTTTTRVLETAAAEGELKPWQGETRLFIRPPYEFRVITGLLTNFHLPRTTLLVLVRTLGGDALMKRAYEEAIQQQYRFYSYGDAMLIL